MHTNSSYPRRLIEVDLPIKAISAHARREKSIRHGHISTLHIWWARRPLAACRAVICAALWPDPVDEHCPQAFRAAAAVALAAFAEQVRADEKLAGLVKDHWTRWNRTNAASVRADNPAAWADMRYALLDFIADFANWDASTVPAFLATARALTQAAHEALGGEPGTRPLVVDPFAGGGSIPLEALRVGADAFASDLNPVAVLLNKVVLEYIPKYGQQLADEVRKWGHWVKEQAEAELAQFYPKDPDGATPIAYLWARTVRCEGPGCGAEVPLIRSLWLAKKERRSVALRMVIRQGGDTASRAAGDGQWVDFEIIQPAAAKDVAAGTVRRGSATCPVCGYTTPVTSVRAQLKPRRGGAADARLFCVVTTRPGEVGRFYRLPTEQDLAAVRAAAEELERRKAAHVGELSLVPEEPLPPQGTLGFRVQLYGMEQWGDLFSPRQTLTLTAASRISSSVRRVAENAGFVGGEALETAMALAVDRLADKNASLSIWNTVGEKIEHVFGRQALPIAWDFAEVGVFSDSTGNWMSHVDLVAKVLSEDCSNGKETGRAVLADAAVHPLPDDSIACFFTDPPYYDAVPYADLSDFFYVWLRRSAPSQHQSLCTASLTPKRRECIVDVVSGKDREHYERSMRAAMGEGRRVLSPTGIGIVVFAHKSTRGWESQLRSMMDAGWTITGSWPIDTERPGRLRAQNSAALASSIHLVCRPRETATGELTDTVGDWRDVLAELPVRVRDWLPRLAREGVVGADAIFACLGPALEIFSRYARVEKVSGEQVTLREYLEHVWAAVAREALGMIFEQADATGFEEDARLTAMWLWTLSTGQESGVRDPESGQSGVRGEESGGEAMAVDDEDGDEEPSGRRIADTGLYVLEYDAARKIAQGLGAHLEELTGLVEVKADKARLLPVRERMPVLFGKAGMARATPRKLKRRQMAMFEESRAYDTGPADDVDDLAAPPGATTLDRVHQAMLLFAFSPGDSLRRFLVDEGVGGDQRFWRLAQALSALYPAHSEEKRWVDGVLARKKALGL